MLGAIDNLRVRLFQPHLCLVVFCCLLISGGCKSISEKVEEHLAKQDFAAARLLLEEEGVGHIPALNADEEDLAARASFEQQVLTHYRSVVGRLLGNGKVRGGLAATKEGLNFCPWSEGLQSDAGGYAETIRALDGLKQQWSSVTFDSSVDIAVARGLAADLEPVSAVLGDTPELEAALQVSTERIGRWWAKAIHKSRGRLPTQQQRELISEFKRLPVDEDSTDSLAYLLREFNVLLRHAEQKPTVELSMVPGALSSIESFTTRFRRDARNRSWGALRPCIESLASHFDSWQASDLFLYFDSSEVSFSTLSLGEKLLADNSSLRPGVSIAHLHRARRRAGEGHQAVLALMHIERAKQIGNLRDESAEELIAVERIARASLSTSRPEKMKIWLDLDPGIDPRFYRDLYPEIRREIASRCQTNDPFKYEKGGLDIIVTKADSFWPNYPRDLRAVTSKHFSHMESVPNPQKKYLERQVDSARISANSEKAEYNSAARALDSAVSSHNIYQSDYSWANYEAALRRFNRAKTRYLYAVDTYNSYVSKYNAEPSLIQRRVYLPYSFREGHVKFGWNLELRGSVSKKGSFRFQEDSIESDFVRIDTDPRDQNEGHRRDDPLNFTVSFDRYYNHLGHVIDKFCDRINPLLAGLEYPKRSELHHVEVVAMGWLLHPWGLQPEITNHLDLPAWISGIADSIKLQYHESPSPEILINQVELPLAKNLDAEAVARQYDSLVCQVVVSDNTAERGWGSGTLISKDGLILTCAHVVIGPKITIRFHQGELKGKDYEGEVVFVNEKNDVALLRAQNLQAKKWAPIRLQGDARRGEKIVAIGYPGMAVGVGPTSANILGTSVGVISNPRIEVKGVGMERLIADITTAKGSSGGPIISMVDGSILGVVTHGSSAYGEKNGISSPHTCLAVPSSRLPEWLGLTSGNGKQKIQAKDLADVEAPEAAVVAKNEQMRKLVRDKLQEIKSEDEGTRAGAKDFFRGIDGNYEEAIAILIEALKDQDHRVQATAAFSLGKIGSAAKEAIPHLRALLEEAPLEAVVQKYAKLALEELEPESE